MAWGPPPASCFAQTHRRRLNETGCLERVGCFGASNCSRLPWKFVHVPKTGGATVDLYFENATECLEVAYANHFESVSDVVNCGRDALVVLREPTSRILSAHRWFERRYGRDNPRKDTASGVHEDGGHHGAAPRQEPLRLDLPGVRERLVSMARAVLNNPLFVPYTFYFQGLNKRPRLLHVWCTESLDAALTNFLCSKTGGAPVQRFHVTHSARDEPHIERQVRAFLEDIVRSEFPQHARDFDLYDAHCRHHAEGVPQQRGRAYS